MRCFAVLARGAAILTLSIWPGIIISLVIGAWPAIHEYGLAFVACRLGPVQKQLRWSGDDLRHADDLVHRFADRRARELRHCHVLTELSPAWLKRPLGIAVELLAAVPSIVYGMWGLLVFGPILSTYVQQPLQTFDGRRALPGRVFLLAHRWASAFCRPASFWPS